MAKQVFLFLTCIFLLSAAVLQAQTREELEKQRAQLKKEMEQTQKLPDEVSHLFERVVADAQLYRRREVGCA